MPGIINGRNKYFGWSMTIALADSSDLWEEELNADGTQYYVDGEWRNLT
jgi:acyl-homoserine lactone acylase PvdQ